VLGRGDGAIQLLEIDSGKHLDTYRGGRTTRFFLGGNFQTNQGRGIWFPRYVGWIAAFDISSRSDESKVAVWLQPTGKDW
jgi:hypothetical protein